MSHSVISPSNLRIYPGASYPLGATWDGMGVNFALFSEYAEAVELCLFDSVDATMESCRILLPEYSDHVWHGYFPDLKPGQLYGYRVYGPWNPQNGHCFNPAKLLVDPYARSIVRRERWHDALYGYAISTGSPAISDPDLRRDERDSAPYAPICAVVDDTFAWGGDHPLRTPWHKTIIYEAHVKGLTALPPMVPDPLRGTYLGLASEPVITHLLDLGVTAVELLPVHQHVDDHFLARKGLRNYWGYNTLGYFAPDMRYSADQHSPEDPVREFKTMVRTLHAAGIEVILDVVYNHTCEGNHLGPTLSFKGIDNLSYYKHVPDNLRYYMDYTGCGNTLNVSHPRVLQLIMDSLRYWVLEMHVDGFRFDLAATLGRDAHYMDRMSSFFDIIHQDPVLCQVKLIAEPWDLGEAGYQVGNFPVLWTEWNGKYRDAVRSFWKGNSGVLAEMATRLAGSSDLYSSKDPHASINFVTSHDGFTLADLVTYNLKHNEANGESNRDGDNHNNSWNCGVEGPTDEAGILTLRARQKRNMVASLLFSLGVPMLLAGDELGRTQMGNNNAYCQDNEISWVHWNMDEDAQAFYRFVRQVIAIRKANPVFQRRKFFMGLTSKAYKTKDIIWLDPKGGEMTEEDWVDPDRLWLGALLNGSALNELDDRGHMVQGDTILMLLNASWKPVAFHLPRTEKGAVWEVILDTTDVSAAESGNLFKSETVYKLLSRSLVLFRLHFLSS